jgi:hypothetical protein
MNDSYQQGPLLELVQPMKTTTVVATSADTHRSLVAHTSKCGWAIRLVYLSSIVKVCLRKASGG